MGADKTDAIGEADIRRQLAFLFWACVLFFIALIAVKAASLALLIINPQAKYFIVDWPDTAAMSEMAARGQLFSPDAHFIAGSQIFGLFPPLFYLLTALFNLITHNTSLSFVLLSVPLQIITTYLVVRDWKDWRQILLLVLLLNFNFPATHFFPVVGRLRELLAVFFLVMLYKNPFKIRPEMLYALCGGLMVLTQPLVAMLGLFIYPLMQAGWEPFKIKRIYLLILLALGALFGLVYYQHFLLKPLDNPAFSSLRCIDSVPIFSSFPAYLLAMFLVPAIFFGYFSPRPVNYLLAAYLVGILFLLVLQNFPDLFITLLRPFKEDLCFNALYPILCFFALFAPASGKPKRGWSNLLAALLILQLLFSIMTWPSFDIGAKTYGQSVFEKVPSGARILAIDVLLWNQPEKAVFDGFNFWFSSEVYLRNASVLTYYSPMQQYYDTERLVPESMALLESIRSQNLSDCQYHGRLLSKRVDYLFVESVATSRANESWANKQLDRMGNASWLEKCGMEKSFNESRNTVLLYKLPGEK